VDGPEARVLGKGMAGAPLRLARALDGSDSAAVFRPGGEDEQDQAAGRNEPAQSECVGWGSSGDWFRRGVVGRLLLLPLLGGKHPE
jgi:hypothetical protein